jgi:hypothetical protein
MEEKAKGYKKLKAWQKADELATMMFQLAARSPQRPFWFMQQVARAAISVPANIAEGYCRGSLKRKLKERDWNYDYLVGENREEYSSIIVGNYD